MTFARFAIVHADGMKLGVLSDTHMPRFGRRLPAALVDGLAAERVEMLVHLGDFTAPDVPGLLEAIAPLEAVAGNNDGPELIGRFGRRRVLEVDGVRIGLVHGDLGRGRRSVDRAASSFADEIVAGDIDAIFFGHSHQPHLERRDGLLLLNPGSPTDKRREPAFSYAIVEVRDGRLDARLVTYLDRRAR